MSHFAQLDENNIVINILVGNDELSNEGYDWIIENHQGRWIKTSYNTIGGVHSKGGFALRKNFAQPGYYYNEDLDAFIPPKPYNSWILDEDTCLWKPPTPAPNNSPYTYWDEPTLTWIQHTQP